MPGRSRQYTMPSVVLTKEGASKRSGVTFDPQPVTKISRPVNTDEHFAIYEFEVHAQRCSNCQSPYEVYRSGHLLCERGHKLAQSVAIYLYNVGGETFSNTKEDSQPVLVELPSNYRETAGLLKAIERSLKHTRRAPFVSQDRSYYVAPRTPERRKSVKIDQERRARPLSGEVVDWPTEMREPPMVQRRATIDVNNTTAKRGSLYEADMAQERRDSRKYNVVVREPTRGMSGYHR